MIRRDEAAVLRELRLVLEMREFLRAHLDNHYRRSTAIEFDRGQSRVAEQFDRLHDLCTLKHCERLVLCCIPQFLRQKVVAIDGAFRSEESRRPSTGLRLCQA